MSSFDDPFDPEIPLDREGCSCGHHKTQDEHDREVAEYEQHRQLRLQTVASSEESRCGGACIHQRRNRHH